MSAMEKALGSTLPWVGSPPPHLLTTPSPYLRHSDSPRAALVTAEDSNSLPFSDRAPESEPEWHLSLRPRSQSLFMEDQRKGRSRLRDVRALCIGTDVEREGEAPESLTED